MPLLDHFSPPLSRDRHWQSLLASWAAALARALNGTVLPPGCFADLATCRDSRLLPG